MKILFVMLHPGYVRYYEPAIQLLAEKGHQIHICFAQPDKQADHGLVQRLSQANSSITFRAVALPKRVDCWRWLIKAVRQTIDYLRYFHPRYGNCPKLKQRLEKKIRKFSTTIGPCINIVRKIIGTQRLVNFLQLIEKTVPPAPRINKFIKLENPDILLATPVITIGSGLLDYLKSAKSLGIRCAVCVASWDNLTNKGLIQIEPERVILWNEIQKTEAIELHGIPSAKVVVTGAQCFDKWFEQKPSTSKEEFCRKVGLASDRPFLLYSCSSPFVTPYEVTFIEEWIKQIENCNYPGIKEMGILVRPHPEHSKQWQDVDFSHLENVAIYPREGAHPVHQNSKADFFDSLHHCSAVMGINTSAMIEAGILGKPVFTILTPDFKDTQTGTLHFHHLVQGGLLYLSEDFDEHLKQLNDVLSGDMSYKKRIGDFIHNFIRPYGLDVACTPIFVDAVESLDKVQPDTPPPLTFWVYPLKLLLFPWAVLWNIIERCNMRIWKLLGKSRKTAD